MENSHQNHPKNLASTPVLTRISFHLILLSRVLGLLSLATLIAGRIHRGALDSHQTPLAIPTKHICQTPPSRTQKPPRSAGWPPDPPTVDEGKVMAMW